MIGKYHLSRVEGMIRRHLTDLFAIDVGKLTFDVAKAETAVIATEDAIGMYDTNVLLLLYVLTRSCQHLATESCMICMLRFGACLLQEKHIAFNLSCRVRLGERQQ